MTTKTLTSGMSLGVISCLALLLASAQAWAQFPGANTTPMSTRQSEIRHQPTPAEAHRIGIPPFQIQMHNQHSNNPSKSKPGSHGQILPTSKPFQVPSHPSYFRGPGIGISQQPTPSSGKTAGSIPQPGADQSGDTENSNGVQGLKRGIGVGVGQYPPHPAGYPTPQAGNVIGIPNSHGRTGINVGNGFTIGGLSSCIYIGPSEFHGITGRQIEFALAVHGAHPNSSGIGQEYQPGVGIEQNWNGKNTQSLLQRGLPFAPMSPKQPSTHLSRKPDK